MRMLWSDEQSSTLVINVTRRVTFFEMPDWRGSGALVAHPAGDPPGQVPMAFLGHGRGGHRPKKRTRRWGASGSFRG